MRKGQIGAFAAAYWGITAGATCYIWFLWADGNVTFAKPEQYIWYGMGAAIFSALVAGLAAPQLLRDFRQSWAWEWFLTGLLAGFAAGAGASFVFAFAFGLDTIGKYPSQISTQAITVVFSVFVWGVGAFGLSLIAAVYAVVAYVLSLPLVLAVRRLFLCRTACGPES